MNNPLVKNYMKKYKKFIQKEAAYRNKVVPINTQLLQKYPELMRDKNDENAFNILSPEDKTIIRKIYKEYEKIYKEWRELKKLRRMTNIKFKNKGKRWKELFLFLGHLPGILPISIGRPRRGSRDL